MIRVVLSIPMGRRLHTTGRSINEATAAICVMQNDDESETRGVAVLYPNTDHMFFVEEFSRDAVLLWRSMYIASKMLYVCNDAVRLALLIAGDTPLESNLFANAGRYLSCDYPTVAALRENAAAQTIPHADLAKLSEMFARNAQVKHVYRGKKAVTTERVQLAFLAHLSDIRNKATPKHAG